MATTPLSKSDFIRNQPATLSAADVVAKAKASGIKFTPQLVYRVRGAAKTKPTKAAAPATKPTASPTSKPSTLSKSDFIRTQPTTLSAAEVVSKAKAEGIKLDPVLVYKVRGRSKLKTVARKPTSQAPKSAASKADFVRAYPSLSAKEVVEKAKAGGIKLGWRYVYNVRASDKAAKKKTGTTKPATSTTTSVNGTAPTFTLPAASSTEDLLRAVAAELGLGRAVEILAAERARVQSILKN